MACPMCKLQLGLNERALPVRTETSVKIFMFISMSTAEEMNEPFACEIESNRKRQPTVSIIAYNLPINAFPTMPIMKCRALVSKCLPFLWAHPFGHGLWSHSSARRSKGGKGSFRLQLMIPKNWYFIYAIKAQEKERKNNKDRKAIKRWLPKIKQKFIKNA